LISNINFVSFRENVELTAIRAERMVSQMREKAETANVFKGDIERRQTVCPECGTKLN
jgi:uncharacterized protein with PIN domain